MKRHFTWIAALMFAFMANAQLPQFSSQQFADWVYTNPAIELNKTTILANRIVLYTTSTGLQLTLTSPQFDCHAGEVIDMNVTWITDQWQSSSFNVSKVALTAALMDKSGAVVDSVTYSPTSVSRTNYVKLSLTVPRSLNGAKLRFASWKADVNSNGAVREIAITSTLRADVNRDGEVGIADVNAVIDAILSPVADEDLNSRADVNGDGELSIADVNSVISAILG
ncbi:MAG: dockerin type I repeat-containing protein [Muribaculaceae bacterium]|nr:dockerin type I repeat-containing protein [Muribaculaceae bacterium]